MSQQPRAQTSTSFVTDGSPSKIQQLKVRSRFIVTVCIWSSQNQETIDPTLALALALALASYYEITLIIKKSYGIRSEQCASLAMIYQKVKAVFVVGLTVSLLLDLEGLFDFYATQVSESLPTKRAYEGVPEVPTTPGSRRHLTSKTETEYRSPLEEFPMQSQDAPLPNVLEVIEQYKQQHSVDALRNDPMIDQRKFIVATYSCPTSAGNWLHYFTSHFFWGILTNRTILWKYADYDTCMGIRADHRYPFNMKRCNVTGVAADCGRLLTRAPWIASFDEWKEKLKLPDTYHIAKHHTQWFLDIPGPPRRKVSSSNR
jgi:hypothetical protein